MVQIDNLRRVDPGYKAPKGKISFSKTEITHITIAVAVLTFAFTILLYRSGNTWEWPLLLGISFVLVFFSFILHEFGHKFTAQRFHAWSEFRIFPSGLFMALIFAFVGFLFAAPGAVYIRGQIDKVMNGKISLAGPGVNFVISAIAIIIYFFIVPNGEITTIPAFVVYELAYLNAFLGLFNMIPILPFDGSKIVAWSIPIYIIAAAVGAIEIITCIEFL
ncbi:MAG: site-2 protease family protein [Candidatus Methanoplasma sp.]|jgi:Zn-dependent protease|nr:site-2 protease family protein [Candidatus Methanoplasma sp.]